MHDESLYAESVLRAGARGCTTKHEGGKELIQAIFHVLSGQIFVGEKKVRADSGDVQAG